MFKKIILGASLLASVLLGAAPVLATNSVIVNHNEESGVYICHKTGNHYTTLYVNANAAKAILEQFESDYRGVCKTPTPSPTATPSATPTATPTPTASPSATPTATPTVTATPSATPSTVVVNPVPVTVNVVLPKEAPNTGRGK